MPLSGQGLLVVILAMALAAAIVAVVALLIARRRPAANESAILNLQIGQAIDALRFEVRASLDGATQSLNQRLAQSSAETDRRLSEMGEGMGRRLETTSGMIGQRLEGAAKAVADVHEKLGAVSGATERVLKVGQEIAELQKILKAPKLRGGFGETFLAELLAQVLPPSSYRLQHGFRGGAQVDAVVKVGDKLVPVDAKFPLENFIRMIGTDDEIVRASSRKAFFGDVKRRIDEIASRYILPDEGTLDFALMYIPAENVYYETIVRDPEGGAALYEYSLKRRVIPVSPNTFYSYLQVILLGLRGLQIEERAHDILRTLGGLGTEIDKLRSEYQILGKHLEDALKKHGEGARRLARLEDVVERLAGMGSESETAAPEIAAPADPAGRT